MELESDKNRESPSKAKSATPPQLKTPVYQALHAARYQRQALIREIQEQTNNRLLAYVGPKASVNRDDTLGIVELLQSVPCETNIDLLLHTPGGDIDAAEKSMALLRRAVGTAKLRVIVPDFAKSAGTLMAVAADVVVMSDSSELGPIDPQIVLDDGRGNAIQHSVLSYIDAFNGHSEALRSDPNDPVARVMLNKIDPATLNVYTAVKERARRLAEDHLNRGMRVPNFTEIANKLIDNKRWLTHGQMIGYQAAQGLKLKIEYLPPEDELWRLFWQLYCQQRLAVKDQEKLFESDFVSLIM
ncbi:MAG: SDH family Clp fold serine proteinase [Planctomycetota bacterium]